jgi:hypothetical protein
MAYGFIFSHTTEQNKAIRHHTATEKYTLFAIVHKN